MYIMRDAALQERLEAERVTNNQVLSLVEGEELSTRDRMKNILIETLHKNIKDPEDNQALDILLTIFEDDQDPDDGVFEGKHGNYDIGDGHVGGDVFKEGTPNNSPESISGVLELATIAKANFGDDTVFANMSDNTLEQQQMHMYAAELAGLNVGNAVDHSSLSSEIKAQMDTAWQQMQNELDPNFKPEIDSSLSVEASLNTDLGMSVKI